jgi:SAM-dependent methyltransferase
MDRTDQPDSVPGALRSRPPEYFDALYAGTPPWDIGGPQPAFLELARAGVFHGQVLDVGCGTGEHALLAASLGLEATGIDSAPTAIAIAAGKARDRGLTARFLVWNALQVAALDEQFDTVIDCGLFHIFADDDRRAFVHNLRAVIRPGGRYFMLCFRCCARYSFSHGRRDALTVEYEDVANTSLDQSDLERLHSAPARKRRDEAGPRLS